jgi:mycofactocin glycosyltransferase
MDKLLPAILKELWQAVEKGYSTKEQYIREKDRLIDECRGQWSQALALAPESDLKQSLLRELGSYIECDDLAEIERRCLIGSKSVEEEWARRVGEISDRTVQQFYDQSEAYLYDLIWWHTLVDDESPLAYLLALRFAQQHGCTRYLDFGSGISSGGILFARHGLAVASADISSTLLRFSQWRFERRHLAAEMLDLKERPLPHATFDFITAMDVWEHLVDPVAAVDQIANTLCIGGFIYGQFALQPEDERPQHLVRDFEPVFQRLRMRGFEQVWQDDWLWGHRVFQKLSDGPVVN